MSKKILVLVVVCCLALGSVVGLTGCQQTPQAATPAPAETVSESSDAAETPVAEDSVKDASDMKILFVCPAVGMPVWQGAREGMEAAAAEFGFEAVWTGADDHSVDKTVEAFEQAIAEKPDAVVTCPFAPAAFETAMQAAKDAGVVVVAVTVDTTTEDQRAAYVGTDATVSGTGIAKALHDVVGDDMKAGIIMSNLDSQNQVIMVDAFKAFISQFPNAEVVDIQEDLTDVSKTMEVFSAMIDANPEMNCLMCTEGNGASPLAQVLAERGLTDKIKVISMDDTDQNLQVIRDGGIYGLMAQDFFQMGYLGCKFAMEAVQGKEVPSITDSGSTLITIDNIDTYKNK